MLSSTCAFHWLIPLTFIRYLRRPWGTLIKGPSNPGRHRLQTLPMATLSESTSGSGSGGCPQSLDQALASRK